MTKKRKKAIGGKHLLIVSSIIALNSLGVSYAYWNDQLQIVTTLKTGVMKPAFCDNYNIKIIREGQASNAQGCGAQVAAEERNSSELSELMVGINNDEMEFDWEVQEHFKAFIHYCVKNEGSLPVKYTKPELVEYRINGVDVTSQYDDNGNNFGLIQLNQSDETIEPGQKGGDNLNGNPKVHVSAPRTVEESEIHKIVIRLTFDQWNKN